MQNVVTTRLLYLVFFKPDTVYYNFSIYCLHIPSPTMLSVALIILPGFAGSLCAGLPFTFYFLQYSNKKVQWASWCALFVIVLGVLLSESRAGSISIFTVLAIYFIHQNKIKFHYKKHIGSFLLCLSFLLISIFVISVTVYHLKKIRQMVDY